MYIIKVNCISKYIQVNEKHFFDKNSRAGIIIEQGVCGYCYIII